MSVMQYVRVIWARKWIVLAVFLIVAAAGTWYAMSFPKQYVAGAELVVDVRADPIIGAVAPGLASPGYMATQLEIFRSERVATQVVRILGLAKSPQSVQKWRDDTQARIPLERYYAGIMQRGLTVEPSRNSNVINVDFTSQDPAFSAAAANAYTQAYIDVSVDMTVAPARQYASWFSEQSKLLQTNLEAAQAKLSAYQREHGIPVSDDRVDVEMARMSSLSAQLAAAQGEQVDTGNRQRSSGTESSPDIQSSGAVQGLKAQLVAAQTKLSELASIVGVNHPARQTLEAQIVEIKSQLAAEVRRVSTGTSIVNKSSASKIAELRTLLDDQKKEVLSMREEHDRMALLSHDVDAAQRAYDNAQQRINQLTLESRTTLPTVRLLSAAVEPLQPSRSRQAINIMTSLAGGLLLGCLLAFGLEFLNRRVRSAEDLIAVPGVPVLGILRPENSKLPVFRRLALDRMPTSSPLLPMAGAAS